MAGSAPLHVPVMAAEAVEALVWREDGLYVDATLGEGGHSRRIAEKLAGSGRLLSIDRDPEAVSGASERLKDYGDRVTCILSSFAQLDELLTRQGLGQISGILFDLGVSSRQLDRPERGFSYRFEGPIDMRMGPDSRTTAAEIVNTWPERELTRLFRVFGEEPRAAAVARSICRARERAPLRTTTDLADAVKGRSGAQPAKTQSRVFQALRIAVNDELASLERVLTVLPERLESGGRAVVIAYHSLEDRMVKTWMRSESVACICPPGLPECRCEHVARLRVLTRRALKPAEEEIAANARARSARLRVVERI